MLPVLLKDMFFFILWLIARILPLGFLISFYVCGLIHVEEIGVGKFVAGALMVTILCCFWGAMAWMFTNAVPALLWRYQPRLSLRTIQIDGDRYKQIKLYGFWFFIGFDSDYEAPRTVYWRWGTNYMFREGCFEPNTFFDFINAHRNIEISTSSNHEQYVKGEKV